MKSSSCRRTLSRASLMVAAALLGGTSAASAASLTWNAGLPGNWDTSNTNWSGSTWSNTNPDDAVFNNVSGTITLTEAITGGSLNFNGGGRESGSRELALTGGNLSVASILSSGVGLGGNVDSVSDAYGQRLRFHNITLNVSGNATATRGMLYFTDATVNIDGKIGSASAWSVFRSDNSTVTVTGGIDMPTIASVVDLRGGTVTTPFIKVGNHVPASNTGLYMEGGVRIVATQDSADYIQVYNDGNSGSRAAATLSAGGATIDTAGRAVTVTTALNGSGGLTKAGNGTLTLTGGNSYTGGTTINTGVLVVAGSYASGSTVINGGRIVNGAANETSFSLNALTLNGGELAATSTPAWNLGNYQLRGNVTVGGASMSTISADVRVINNEDRTFTVGDVDGGAGVDLLISGKIGHHNNSAWGYATKAGAGTMKISGVNELGRITVSAGLLILEDAGISGFGNGGLVTNAASELRVTTGSATASFGISGSGTLTKTGDGTLTLTSVSSHTGGTTVNAGTLSLPGGGGNGRLRGALTVNAGGTVTTTGDGTGLGYNNQISSVTINGGLLKTTDSNSHIWNIVSGVTMTGGELQTNGGASNANGWAFQWNRTSLTTNASTDSAVISGRINLRNDGGYSSWDVNVADGAADADLLVSAAITGSGVALTKNGNGKMRLTGSTSFNGAINVNSGMLELPNGDWVTGDPWGNTNWKGQITIGADATLSTSDGVTQFRNGLTLNGGTLSSRGQFYAGGWRNVVISSDVSAGGAAVSTIASALNLDGSRNWTVGTDSTLNVTGEVGSQNVASGSLTKSGNGTLVLSGVNTYAGNTTINGGMLVLDAVGGTYAYNGGTITINGGSTLRVRGQAYTFNGKTIAFGAAGGGTLDAIATGGGGMHLTGGNTITTSGGAQNTISGTRIPSQNQGINLNGQTLNFDVAAGADPAVPNLNVTGTLWNSGNLTKSGNGILLLSGNNEYAGSTTVNAGNLMLRGASASSSFVVSNGGVLEFDVASGSRDSATTTFTGTGTLRKSGGGQLTWGSSTATFALGSGALIDVQGGLFTGGSYNNEDWSTNLSDLNVGTGAVFDGVEANVRVNRITGSGTIKTGYAGYQNLTVGVDNGSSTFDGVISDSSSAGNLVKAGTGSIALSGTNTYSGGTVVNAGTLALTGNGSVNSSASVTINGGTAALAHRGSVDLTSPVNLTLGTVSGTGTINDLTVADLADNTLAPGTAGVGQLTVNNLTFNGAAKIRFLSDGTAVSNRLSTGTLTTNGPGSLTIYVDGVTPGSWVNNTYLLLNYSTLSGAGAAAFAPVEITGKTARTLASLANDTVAKTISLIISTDVAKWTGTSSGEWNAGTTPAPGNWSFNSPQNQNYFINDDAVLFDDSASRGTVEITEDLLPTSVTVDNATLTYTLTSLGGFGIGGTGGLTKKKAGVLIIDTENYYQGATIIEGGTLRMTRWGKISFATAALSLRGGALDLGMTTQYVGPVTITAAAASGDTILNGSLTGTSYAASNQSGNAVISASLLAYNGIGFTKTGAGTLTLSGDNTFDGNFVLNAGQVNVESENALGAGTLLINGGTLGNASGSSVTLSTNNTQSWNGDFGFNGTSDLNLGTGAVTVSANRTVTVDAGTLTVGGSVVGGAFTLTKSGSGKLTLAAGSTLTGVTTVSGGTLVYGGSYASSTHSIGSGAVLEIAVASGQRDSTTTTFSGAGTLRKSGSGRVLWGGNIATFALGSGSLIDVQGGLFTAGSNANENWTANLSSLNVESGAVFDTVEANVRVDKLTGTGTIRTGYSADAGYRNLTIGVDNGSSTFGGVIENSDATGNLVKIGTGTITLSGTTTHTGTTTVADGTLRAGSSTAFTNKGRLALANGGIFDLGGYNAAFTSFESTSSNLITNTGTGTHASGANAVGTPAGTGVYVDAFTLSASDQTINARITDGTDRRTQLVIANNNSAADLANILNGANSFSGGLVLTHTAGGTRLRLNSPLSGTPFGSGPIIIGQAATDKAQILFDSASPVTLANDIVVNTALGSDNGGALRVDTAGHVVSGKITANLAALHIANGGGIRLTGQVTGASGLILERGVTVTLANATANANDYAGDTVINLGAANGRSATLRLGGANQIPTGANAGNVTVSSSGNGVGLLDLNGYDQRINGLSGNGFVDGRSGGSAGTNTLTVGDNHATSTFAGIIRNSVGTLALTKTGNGLLSLEGDNTYDGVTAIEAGTLRIVGRLGRGAVTIASGATLEVNRSSDYVTSVGQRFSGDGRLVKNGAGNLTFAYATTQDEPLVSGLQNLEINGGVVRTDNWARWKTDLNLTVNGTGVFEMWNTTTSLGTLNGNGTVKNSANWSGGASGAAYATNNLSVAAGNFAGTITDNGIGDGGNTGPSGDSRINLIKSGPGTLTLSAANTYGGTTTVNGGRLVVTHASALGGGAVTINTGTLQVDAASPIGNAISVNNGGTLGGKGSTNSVTVASGGALSPGASLGTLNTGNLTLLGGSIINWQVRDAAGTAGVSYDQLIINGTLDLTQANPNSRIILKISSINALDQFGTPVNFDAPNGVASIRTFQLGQVNGGLLNNGRNISDVFAFDVDGFRYSDGSTSNAALWSISWDGAGAITLTAVPEPSTYGLGLGALALAAASLRRRRKQTPAS